MKTNFTPGNAFLRRSHSKCNDKKPHYRKSQPLKDLEKLCFELKQKRYPLNQYLVAESFRDDTANGLTKAIITYIQLKGGQAERISTTGRPIDRTQTFTDVTGRTRTIGRIEWIKSNCTNGSADVSATIKGRSLKIEVKISDRQSPAQKRYQQAIETAGGLYVIARTFEEFVTWYNQKF